MALRVVVRPFPRGVRQSGLSRGFAAPAGRGNVVLVGDDDIAGELPRFWSSPAFSSKTSGYLNKSVGRQQKVKLRQHKRIRGLDYNLPAAYQDLLQEHQENEKQRRKGQGSGSAALRRGAAWQWPHELWQGVQRTARERLGISSSKDGASSSQTGEKSPTQSSADGEKSPTESSTTDAITQTELKEGVTNQMDLVDQAPSWSTLLAKWHETLWIEEVAGHIEMRRLDFEVQEPLRMPHWRPGREGPHDLYELDLSGLSLGDSEGDLIARLTRTMVQLQCSSGTFTGFAQPGGDPGSLLLAVPDSRIANAEPPFQVRFQLPRFTFRAMHRALDFPIVEKFCTSPARSTDNNGASGSVAASTSEEDMEARVLEAMRPLPRTLNEYQKRAVATILEWKAQEPLVVWGPPGTGKTTMAAFVVWHLLQQRPDTASILVAAPSNTGADVFCKKLARLGLTTRQMFRLNALGRSISTVDEALIPYCRTSSTQGSTSASFVVPALEELRQFQIIVTTCICASHITNALQSSDDPVKNGWFSHVLVDEAGEATEPETFVPLTLLRPTAGVAVLLGDHFQLGPMVQAPRAAEFAPLRTPMLARLANDRLDAASADRSPHRDALRRCESFGLLFLTETYRSHPAIMELYSRVFYNDQLEHRPRDRQCDLLKHFNARGLEAPLIFHHVQGKQHRDPDSFSWYNLEEVRLVQQYLTEIIDDSKVSVDPSEVGIITPYVKQAQHIRLCLRSLGAGFEEVEVGTVEHFQGREKKLIIASAVRSSELDSQAVLGVVPKRPIGFLADPHRLNVTVSRAVAGLIVIGDLQLLTDNDRHWRAIVHLARDMGALRGLPFHSDRALASAEEKPKIKVQATDATNAWETLMD